MDRLQAEHATSSPPPDPTAMADGPLVIAHRGFPSAAPENTVAGAMAAVAAGADVVEVDVRLSGDGVPVIVHDWHVRRIGGRFRRVSSLTAGQLGATRVLGTDQTIPTLAAVLEVLGQVGIALDIKDAHAVTPILAVLDRVDFAGKVLGWSQHAQVIHDLVAAAPSIEVGLLRSARRPRQVASFLADATLWQAQAVSADERIIDHDFVSRAGAMGLGVYTMVNAASTDALARMSALGVRGVITDWPSLAKPPR
jgi:glycerophosphoryl diester phosphodiesterase